MSESIPTPGSQFQPNYELPEDQIAAEMQLLNEFRQRYPRGLVALSYNLIVLQRAAGMEVPTLRIHGLISDEPVSEREKSATIDEDNFFRIRWTPNNFSMLFMPPENEPRIIGEMPPEAEAMVDGLYGLVGARTLRSDHGRPRGVVVRGGIYHETPVYFEEGFNIPGHGEGYRPIFTLAVIGEIPLQQALAKP